MPMILHRLYKGKYSTLLSGSKYIYASSVVILYQGAMHARATAVTFQLIVDSDPTNEVEPPW
jgi:hypothetical protein